MDWGTPRLVTKNKLFNNMDNRQLESRSVLLKMANVRKGIAEPDKEKTKTGFANSSITSFRKRMMEEEKASEGINPLIRQKTANEADRPKPENKNDAGPTTAISYGLLPVPENVDRS